MINSTDSDSAWSLILVANSAKIPVITLDRSVNEAKVTAHIVILKV
ncbi:MULTISPECIES: hypothetical protein [unclassified Bartonella]|nr:MULTISPECIES: hypothetical protein [unclassified Bartonella]AQX28270.1 ribose transport system substrate-binding protein [Bartonella sp. JB15]AQX29541.1 ribose transport system substrate-binding protein [Bartonella sp. JB63]